ncbi:MAG: nucleic acid-binding protein, partial [Bacillota bacterium]|nr:nucleic acid-binding protein [Bacillota bacterium]
VITLLFRREVFSEACSFVAGILAAADQGYLIVERVTPARFAAAWKLRLRFNDKPQLSFTDLTSMAVMRERGITQVLTEDQHFLQVGMGFQIVPEV